MLPVRIVSVYRNCLVFGAVASHCSYSAYIPPLAHRPNPAGSPSGNYRVEAVPVGDLLKPIRNVFMHRQLHDRTIGLGHLKNRLLPADLLDEFGPILWVDEQHHAVAVAENDLSARGGVALSQ
jgi:hypothetical protein